MIPPTGANGYLPPGIHPATMEEIIDRFGHGSDQREAQAQSLGITRILINGSFVTDYAEPNDVDVVVLVPADYDESSPGAERLLDGLPFLEIKAANQADYGWFVTLFSTDRDMMKKGVVEVRL